jgi:hypothetical protein
MGIKVKPTTSSDSNGRPTASFTRSRSDKVALLALLGIVMLLFAGFHCFMGLQSNATFHVYGGNSCFFTVCVAIISLFFSLTVVSHAAAVPGTLTIPWMEITFLIEKPPRRQLPVLNLMLL